jgi:uncharacterized membrane protein YkvA (DUF1232 family)
MSEPTQPSSRETQRATKVEVLTAAEARRRLREGARAENGELMPGARKRPMLKRLLAGVPGVPTVYGLWIYLMDDNAPDLQRLMILSMFLYVVFPTDFLPEALFGPLGLTDDIAVFWGLLKFIGSDKLKPYREEAKRRLRAKGGEEGSIRE